MPQLRYLPLLFAISLPLQAADDSLDSVLQGFDEPGSSAADSTPAANHGRSELEAVLGGFDEPVAAAETASTSLHDKVWQIAGTLSLSAAYNYAHQAPAPGQSDYRGLSRLRSKLNLEHDYDFGNNWRSHLGGYAYYDFAYRLHGRDNYSDEVLEEFESEAELGEAWLQGKLNQQTDLKLGRQIVVWGKSDNIRVTDIINPMDNREPGMVDIEDLRLPLGMLRLDHYIGAWGITALAIPEVRFNKLPPYGSDFYPLPGAMPDEEIPDDTEYAIAANGIFSGWDLSLYWASLYDDNPHTVITPSGPRLQHSRLTMLGSAANAVSGNWLYKGELARFSGLEYTSQPNQEFTRTDTLLGVEYSGLRETSLSLEVVNRHLHNHQPALLGEGVEEDTWQTALRYSGDFLHARLHLLALLSAFGKEFDGGGFGRYSASYDIADGMALTGGVVSYQSGNQLPFGAYGDNDRLFMELKYSF